MNTTPQSNRLHVGIFGDTNAGKSSLFNALTNTDIAIVSDTPGTTTDSVQKSMELLPFGPIVLIDTAGLNDTSELGRQRVDKALKILKRVDFAIYVGESGYDEFTKKASCPHMQVISFDIKQIKETLAKRLSEIQKDSDSLLAGLLKPGSTVLMVAPIDSEAPKNRLILPQAQLIRDCLDNGFFAIVVTEKEVEEAIKKFKDIDLVVTDSQVFGLVSQIVPTEIKLTSFSILMARQKGDIESLLEGLKAIPKLKDNDKILMAEVCTHTNTHEDIGRVKIPAALQKMTGKKLDFEFVTGRDFPDDLSEYAMIIHCGACMITAREMQNRIESALDAGIPITNYGLFLAQANGILSRSIEILGGTK